MVKDYSFRGGDLVLFLSGFPCLQFTAWRLTGGGWSSILKDTVEQKVLEEQGLSDSAAAV